MKKSKKKYNAKFKSKVGIETRKNVRHLTKSESSFWLLSENQPLEEGVTGAIFPRADKYPVMDEEEFFAIVA